MASKVFYGCKRRCKMRIINASSCQLASNDCCDIKVWLMTLFWARKNALFSDLIKKEWETTWLADKFCLFNKSQLYGNRGSPTGEKGDEIESVIKHFGWTNYGQTMPKRIKCCTWFYGSNRYLLIEIKSFVYSSGSPITAPLVSIQKSYF